MPFRDSSLDPAALAEARDLLAAPAARDPTWPALMAAAALALTSVVFAAMMVLAPPAATPPAAQAAPS